MTERPTVGRIVHYHNVSHENRQPYPALVTAVPPVDEGNPSSEITVTVFTPEGGRFATTISENQTTSDVREWWEWPPRT